MIRFTTNIQIRKEDTYKMGFKTNKGLYDMDRTPSAYVPPTGQTFTHMLNEVLRPLYAQVPPASSVTT